MVADPETAALIKLGFSELEARIYGFLLSESPVGEARLSEAIGADPDAVAAAVTVLRGRGAILPDAGDPGLCRPVPAPQMIRGQLQSFEVDCDIAEAVLNDLYAPVVDQRVYRLNGVEAVIVRIRNLIRSAKDTLVIDVTPGLAALFVEDVRAAQARGVIAGAVVYDEGADYLEGDAAVAVHDASVYALWPGEHASVVIDADEAVIAYFNSDLSRVVEAMWTRSAFLSLLLHCGVTTELMAYCEAGESARRLLPSAALPRGFRAFLDSVEAPS